MICYFTLKIFNFLNRYINMGKKDDFEVTLQAECYEGSRKHRFNIQYYIYEADGMFIAYCPALDITSTGEDINDVVTQFYEHFQLYVECCIEDNTLIQDLQNHGFKSFKEPIPLHLSDRESPL